MTFGLVCLIQLWDKISLISKEKSLLGSFTRLKSDRRLFKYSAKEGLKPVERCPAWVGSTAPVWRSLTAEVLALFNPHNRLFNCLDTLLQRAGGALFGAIPAYVTQSQEVWK